MVFLKFIFYLFLLHWFFIIIIIIIIIITHFPHQMNTQVICIYKLWRNNFNFA